MARLLVYLPLLIFASLFNLQFQNQAEADYKLIHALCHNSETPETCMRCFKSDPHADKVDSVGIATIVVNCIISQANTLVANITRLASEATDQKVKSICQNCIESYSTAKNELTSAKQQFHEHKYDNAEISVVRALMLDKDCSGDIKAYQSGYFSDIVFGIKIYEELSEAARRIIEKLY